MKTIKITFLTLILLIVMSVPTLAASNSITIYVNGKKQNYNPSPVVIDDRVLVPMRDVFETLNAEVKWDADTRTVLAKSEDGISIELPLGSLTATVNGGQAELEVPAQIINGRTMIPLGFVLRSLNYLVDWDPQTKTVLIGIDAN